METNRNLSFFGRYFQMEFSSMKIALCWYFFIILITLSEIYSKCPNWQWSHIGSDNGLASNRQQAIMGINDWLVWWLIMMFLDLDGFFGVQRTKAYLFEKFSGMEGLLNPRIGPSSLRDLNISSGFDLNYASSTTTIEQFVLSHHLCGGCMHMLWKPNSVE